jgi:hypothetical protein
MNPYGDVLARVETELDLPYPERALLIEELAGDLAAAAEALAAGGAAAKEAHATALQAGLRAARVTAPAR